MDTGTDLLIRALDRGASVRLQMQGSCMRPQLQDRDWAWIEPITTAPRRGDIVLARTHGQEFVCHRVLARSDRGILAAGDRSSEVLEHSTEEVLGRLVAVERGHRKWPIRRGPIDGLLAQLHLSASAARYSVTRRLIDGIRRRWLARRAASSSARSWSLSRSVRARTTQG